jgi:hypothetical protein
MTASTHPNPVGIVRSKHDIGSLVRFVDWEDALQHHNSVIDGIDSEPIERIGILMAEDPDISTAYVFYDGGIVKAPDFLIARCEDGGSSRAV